MEKTSFTIKKAQTSDINTIVTVHKKCVQRNNSKDYPLQVIEKWLKQISAENVRAQLKNSAWIVGKLKNVVAGFAQYSIQDGELYQIQVSPEYQSKGYGKLLYTCIEQQFIKANKDKIKLQSTLTAKGFYIKLGFKPIEKIKYDGIELISMEKDLTNTPR